MIRQFKTRKQAGFTAVELLIALTIAATLLIAGYQLYAVIIQDSGDVRQRSRASNLALDYLRRYSASAPVTCSASTVVNNQAVTPTPPGLSDVFVTVSYTCPQASIPTLTRVQVKINYSGNKEVTHAIYRTPS